jgi:hypothetical protein
MSFKSWSSAQGVASEGRTADKPKAVPATSQPAVQLDKAPAEVLPAAKLPPAEPTNQAAKLSEMPKT